MFGSAILDKLMSSRVVPMSCVLRLIVRGPDSTSIVLSVWQEERDKFQSRCYRDVTDPSAPVVGPRASHIVPSPSSSYPVGIGTWTFHSSPGEGKWNLY